MCSFSHWKRNDGKSFKLIKTSISILSIIIKHHWYSIHDGFKTSKGFQHLNPHRHPPADLKAFKAASPALTAASACKRLRWPHVMPFGRCGSSKNMSKHAGNHNTFFPDFSKVFQLLASPQNNHAWICCKKRWFTKNEEKNEEFFSWSAYASSRNEFLLFSSKPISLPTFRGNHLLGLRIYWNQYTWTCEQ